MSHGLKNYISTINIDIQIIYQLLILASKWKLKWLLLFMDNNCPNYHFLIFLLNDIKKKDNLLSKFFKKIYLWNNFIK